MDVVLVVGAAVAVVAGVAGWVRARGRKAAQGAEPEAVAPVAESRPAPAPVDDDGGDLTVMMRRQG